MAAKRLKVFRAHFGFYDTVVAAPSQKAALAAWGATRNEFANGFANQTSDPAATTAALAHPGQILKRPFGSTGDYKIEADPVPAPSLSLKQRRVAATARRSRMKKKAKEQRAAEKELHDAQRAEARALKELTEREEQIARERKAVRAAGKKRITRAKLRLAYSK